MRRQRKILIFTACVLTLVIASTFPLNYVRKHVQECRAAHEKLVAKQCLRDSVTSSDATDTVSLPASAPAYFPEVPARKVTFFDSWAVFMSASIGPPPLRC